MQEKRDFLPVLLGSDINVYGMARAFHEAYGLTSLAIGKATLSATKNSKIVKVAVVEPNLEDNEVFCKTLIDFAKEHADKPRLLVGCSDGYVKLIMKNQELLRNYYYFQCLPEDLYNRLSSKKSFYELCEQYGFLYPKTATVTNQDYEGFRPPFPFPVIVKASNSVAYWQCSFPFKKKCFVAYNKEEFDDITKAIYGSSYQDSLIIQEFIPGEDGNMRVMNCYCGKDGKVKLSALGHVLLEEHTPGGIGSYAAIIPTVDRGLSEKVRAFLEDIGYTGIANFDIKYDPRDGQYKFFEINLRQGRSSFFVTAEGYNLAWYLAEDLLYNTPMEFTIAEGDALWTIIPKSVIHKYVKDESLKQQAARLYGEKKVCRSSLYPADTTLSRRFRYLLMQVNYIRKYKKYFGNKGLH